jgi:hypothetical protein
MHRHCANTTYPPKRLMCTATALLLLSSNLPTQHTTKPPTMGHTVQPNRQSSGTAVRSITPRAMPMCAHASKTIHEMKSSCSYGCRGGPSGTETTSAPPLGNSDNRGGHRMCEYKHTAKPQPPGRIVTPRGHMKAHARVQHNQPHPTRAPDTSSQYRCIGWRMHLPASEAGHYTTT